MNDPEELLSRLTPHGADPHLAERIHTAVASELAQPVSEHRSRWQRWESRIGWLTAAAVILGIVLNVVVNRIDRERQAQVMRAPPPDVRDLVRMVESATDAETGAWVKQQFSQVRAVPPRSAASPGAFENYVLIIMREVNHETANANSQATHPGRRRPPGACLGCECDLRLADGSESGSTTDDIERGRETVVGA